MGCHIQDACHEAKGLTFHRLGVGVEGQEIVWNAIGSIHHVDHYTGIGRNSKRSLAVVFRQQGSPRCLEQSFPG
jgi:hypothetical protein